MPQIWLFVEVTRDHIL